MMRLLSDVRSITREVLRRRPIRGGDLPKHTRDHLQAVRRDGVCVWENYLPPDICDQLVDELDAVLVEYRDFVQHYSSGAEQRLFGVERISKGLGVLWNDSALASIMKAYCTTDRIVGFTMANRIEAHEGNVGSGNGWHRDSVRGRQFKAIVYLNDVGPENGPFQYWRGSHRLWHRVNTAIRLSAPFDQNRFDDGSFDHIFERSSEVVTLTARKGTVILADTTGLHRGCPLSSGVRYAMTNYYFDVSIPSHIESVVIEKAAAAT